MNNFIEFLNGNGVNNPTQLWAVVAADTAILPGQPVVQSTTKYVTAAPTGSPVVGTDVYMGHSLGNSSQTATADGTVKLYIPMQQQTLILPAKVAADVNTQSKYDALVNGVVLFDLTAGVYTIDTTTLNSSASNGLYVMPLDITVYPGVVAFIVRQSATFLA